MCIRDRYIRPEIPVYAPQITVVPPEVPSLDQLYDYFNRKIRERQCCVLHTKDDFVTILRDLQLDGGQMLTALNEKDQPIGMEMCIRDRGTTAITTFQINIERRMR